jgi:hypothetical protein
MKLKNIDKKIRRLVTKIAKDTKRLAKLRLKLSLPPKKKKKPSAKKSKGVARRKDRKGKKLKASAPVAKRKRNLTPEGRAKLAAAMNARWAAKRAAAQSISPSPIAATALDSGTAAPFQ